MLIVIVHVVVKPGFVEQFKSVSMENAKQSVQESGVARFDVIQDKEHPERFALIEVYRNDEAPAAHKQTPHYAAWRDAVESMMAEPRRSVKYLNVFPEDNGW